MTEIILQAKFRLLAHMVKAGFDVMLIDTLIAEIYSIENIAKKEGAFVL